MGGSIRLSEKHGVNPGLENCFICNQPKGVILFGEMTKKAREELAEIGAPPGEDGEAPRQGIVLDKEPCHKCAELMEKGVILISVRDSEEPDENPYRTGGWVVVKDRVIEELVTPKSLRDAILKRRVAFLPDEVWDKVGLPRGPVEGVPSE